MSLKAQTNVNLMPFNTMRLSCLADKMITLKDESDIEPVFETYHQSKSSTFILSGGSNLILPSKLNAVVIHPNLKGLHIVNNTEDYIDIEVMSGENWHELVVHTVNQGWYGLENLALIPGLVGASPVQNIGAYGVQLEDCITHVKAFHIPSLRWYQLSTDDCEFDYRNSKFKREAGDWLISRVGFRLHKDTHKINADYGDVSKLAIELAHTNSRVTPTPLDVMHAIITIRQSKLPDPSLLPNCGSYFKNPIIDNTHYLNLKTKYPTIVGYPMDNDRTKVAAGWLIDTAGLKGKGIEPILTHTKQALVLVNHSTEKNVPADQSDILATQQFIQQAIQQKFDIALEREPVWVDTLGNQSSY